MEKLICLMAILLLAACGEDAVVHTNKNKQMTEQTTPKTMTSNTGYDFTSWQKTSVAYRGVNTQAILALIGLKPQQNDSMPDYYGDTGRRLKLRGEGSVFFNIIDSQELVELNWFRHNSAHDAHTKKTSIENTQKAYEAATAMLKETGGKIVQEMVLAEEGSSASTQHDSVIMAQCESFYCRLVIHK